MTTTRMRDAVPPRVRVAAGVAFSASIVVACFLPARRLTTTAWPLQAADHRLVIEATVAYLASFLLRALGWQRLFPLERPDRSRCLAACGAAAASGVVLAALVTSSGTFRLPLVVVLLFSLGCVATLLLGPKLVRLPFADRSDRIQQSLRRLGEHAGISRSTFVAGEFLFSCWTTRAIGCALLLSALGAGFSLSFAPVVICLAAATSILPITAGGAIVNIGTTSAVLIGLGVTPRAAINFSLASGMLLTLSALAAAVVGTAGSIFLTTRRRHLGYVTPG